MEIVHKFKINCGMTFGAFLRGVMMLFKEKRNQLHYWDHYYFAQQCYFQMKS
jgi:hypothetical protein